jgi:hypothetical protein
MSRISVRRLTAAIALLAVLCLAMPAAAAPVRPHSPKASAVSLFDQFLTWIGSFLPGQAPAAKSPAEKAISVGILPGGTSGTSLGNAVDNADRGAMIDPNG